MKPLKSFKEFLEQGIVKKQSPNTQRAESLIQEAKQKKDFFDQVLKKFGIEKTNSNYIVETCYDVLIELIRAKMFLQGLNSSNSHEAEVSYMRELNFGETDVHFMNNLRYYRNGIKYYGRSFDKEYSSKVLKYLNKIYPRLLIILK